MIYNDVIQIVFLLKFYQKGNSSSSGVWSAYFYSLFIY